MSFRLRLALALSLMLAVALGAFGLGMHVAVERMTRDAMARELAQRAQRLIAASDVVGSDAVRFTNLGDDLSRMQVFDDRCTIDGVAGRIERLVNKGRLLPLSGDGRQALLQGRPVLERSLFDSATHLIYSQPILDDDGLIGVAQVAQPVGEQERLLASLRDGVLFGGGALAVLVFGLTWGVAGRALQPLMRITRAARAVTSYRDLPARIEPAPGKDEFGQLAISLDHMLGSLRAAHQQIELQLDAQRDFVADVSHELRAPLTTVRGNLGLLQREAPVDAEERRAILRDAVDEIERMSRLVNEMLLLARTNAAQPLRLMPVDVVPLAGAMRRKVTALAQGRDIALLTSAERVVAIANPDALNQVLLILLDNAAKFTPRDGRITLTVETSAAHARISVKDTGAGIPPGSLAHVFERYYQVDGSGSGAGLGLSIAKALVEAQGGTIAAHSEPGRGSTFTISLPLA